MDPHASRPHMPGYGIEASDAGLLPWAAALELLISSHDYWLCTTWPDGRPHVMPVWGVWDDDALWFSSSGQSRKTLNLTRDPRCTAATDDPYHPVVVEGRAERVVEVDGISRFANTVNAKYETDYGVEFFSDNACWRMRPTWAFALSEGDFTGTPTRWRF